jgi:hypothetical protein
MQSKAYGRAVFPGHVRADARDTKIKQYLVDKKYDVPNSDGALRKAVQRALKG